MLRNRTLPLIVASIALGILSLAPADNTHAFSTSVSAEISKIVICSHSTSTVDLGNVSPGQLVSTTYTIGVNTNSAAGFTVKSTKIDNLARSGGSEAINYNANTSASSDGYKITPTTYSEWNYQDGSAYTSGSVVQTGSTWTHNGTSATETLTLALISSHGVAGTYEGEVSWTCGVN